MDIAEVQKFVAENHRGVLVARKRDGWPQLTLVAPAVDAEGRVIVHSRAAAFQGQEYPARPAGLDAGHGRAVQRLAIRAASRHGGGRRAARGYGYLDLLAPAGQGRASELAGVPRENERGAAGRHSYQDQKSKRQSLAEPRLVHFYELHGPIVCGGKPTVKREFSLSA